MKNLICFAVASCLFLHFMGCNTKTQQNCCVKRSMDNTCIAQPDGIVKMHLDTVMARIELESKSFVKKYELTQSKSFYHIYVNYKIYKNDIIAYVCDTTKSLSYRHWAIASQSLCEDNYYAFSVAVTALFKQGKIEEDLLYTLINPDVNDHLSFIRDHDNARFRNLLLDLKQHERSVGFRDYIDDVLSNYICCNFHLYR